MDNLYDGTKNIAIGFEAGESLSTGSDNIDLYTPGASGESGVIRIGTQGTQTAAYVAGVYGATSSSGVEASRMSQSVSAIIRWLESGSSRGTHRSSPR